MTDKPSGVRRSSIWRLSYWRVVLTLIALVEVTLAVLFVLALRAYHRDTASSCIAECLGTFFAAVYAGASLILWPIISLFLAAVVRVIGGELLTQFRREGRTRLDPRNVTSAPICVIPTGPRTLRIDRTGRGPGGVPGGIVGGRGGGSGGGPGVGGCGGTGGMIGGRGTSAHNAMSVRFVVREVPRTIIARGTPTLVCMRVA